MTAETGAHTTRRGELASPCRRAATASPISRISAPRAAEAMVMAGGGLPPSVLPAAKWPGPSRSHADEVWAGEQHLQAKVQASFHVPVCRDAATNALSSIKAQSSRVLIIELLNYMNLRGPYP